MLFIQLLPYLSAKRVELANYLLYVLVGEMRESHVGRVWFFQVNAKLAAYVVELIQNQRDRLFG